MSKELIKRTLELNKVEMEIDLAGFFGVDSIPRDVSERLGQACIDHIVERTGKGKDVDGNRFTGYDKDYIDSDEFEAWGKSPRKINMELTGDMLGTLDIIDIDGGRVKIGWKDDTEIKKAFNHNTGDTVPKREFFGLTDSQLKQLAEPFAEDIKKVEPSNKELFGLLDYLTAAEEKKNNQFLLDLFWGQDGNN